MTLGLYKKHVQSRDFNYHLDHTIMWEQMNTTYPYNIQQGEQYAIRSATGRHPQSTERIIFQAYKMQTP